MNPKNKSRISGALYDFMGYLTTRDGDFVYGASHECATDILNHFKDWASKRGLSPYPIEPDIQNWNLGESMIDVFLEFYGQGNLPIRAPGYSSVGTAGSYSDTGRVDTTDYSKRRKWLDAKSKGGVGSISKTHPDDPEHENFGLGGLPGGVRDDPESPNSYGDFPGNDD